ncbi:MAG: ATP-binding cassette domain-containing protein [Saprospiraceae bacterium]|nr:ATP-binding cassette domain-containing protein [Saprospiraceae bacterium]MBK8450617.1 ATP-binding cassette domain-containing protein [Saprospiraceae bacterium]MBK9720449.1 ATP-binding cassette domain-containing protein [Saprospiraceae bacterium]
MSNLLTLNQVVKEYNTFKAVDQVSFSVPESCIVGLLGPNGAGKTSLIRIITGITQADSGKVLLHGEDIYKIKNPSIGYMPEERGLYKKMKVGEQLIFLTRLRGLSKTDAERNVVFWMKKFQIESWWNKRVDELSKGMSQKVQFIATVSHNPKLIILDEPFSGLDPINTNLIKEEIIRLKNEGASILFSTHRMEQVEEMCEYIVLINKGKIVLNGEVNEVRNEFKEHLFEVKTENEVPDEIHERFELIAKSNKHYLIKVKDNQSTNEVLTWLINHEVRIASFSELLPTFSEIFIKTVNETNHE